MVFEAITALLLAYQTTAPEFRHNSLYTFNVDPKSSEIVIMNTQTGHIYRCTTEEECNQRLKNEKIVDFNQKSKYNIV